jgi:polar amino acid transport system substrate-binding protein
MHRKASYLAFIIAVIALAMVFFRPSATVTENTSSSAQKETAFARVMRTHTIRCAYADLPPALIIDPNTKKLSGIYYDILEEIAHRLNLDLQWTEEVGYGNINTGFDSGRYDLFCAQLFPTAARAKNSLFTVPIYFDPLFVWVRANDTRFDGDIHKLNDPQYGISMTDGDMSQAIVDQDFPLAKHVTATQSSDVIQHMQDVTTGKADAMMCDRIVAGEFMAHNPGALKNAAPDNPIRVYSSTIMLPFGEYELKSVLDTVIGEMQADGTIERTVKKYMGDNPPVYFVNTPYKVK